MNENRQEQLHNQPSIEIINYVAAIGKPTLGKRKQVVVPNSSAALTEGISIPEKGMYDAYDSGGQLALFCPPGGILPVQFPEGKLTEENVTIAHHMFQLEAESLERIGIQLDLTFAPTENIHDFVAATLNDDPNTQLIPLFVSTRIAESIEPEHSVAHAAAHVNNKTNFIKLLHENGLAHLTPKSYLYDPITYPESGFPSKEQIIAEQTSPLAFFKLDVSAGGSGVQKVALDSPEFGETYDLWTKRMQSARQQGSQEYDFHIQQGIAIDTTKPDTESPCITAVIHPLGGIRVLQVALQRLENGTNHIGNIVDPVYEKQFLNQHQHEILAVLEGLKKRGLRGHAGIDVLFDREGKMFVIEVNPRLNGNSRIRRLRDHLPADTYISTNNEIHLTQENMPHIDELRNYFYDANEPKRPAVVITRFPRFAGDAFGLDFINDRYGQLEEKIIELLH